MTLEVQPITAHDNDALQHGINHIAFSLDGRRMATSDVDMNVEVFEDGFKVLSKNFESENEKVRPTERVRGLAFSPDGMYVYVAAGEMVWAIQIRDGQWLWRYTPPRSFGFLIVSPCWLDVATGGDVAAAFDDGSMVVWDPNGEIKVSWRNNDVPRTFRFDPTGELLVGTSGSNLSVWNVAQRRRKLKIPLASRTYSLDLNPDGSIVATRSLNDVTLWDISSKNDLGSFPMSAGLPILAFHPTKRLLACGEHERVRLVDFEGRTVAEYGVKDGFAICVAFNRSGSELLVGSTMGRVLHFDVDPHPM